MARRRGFWAELHHQNQLAQKRELQAQHAQARAAEAAQRRADQARRQAERARNQQARAAAAHQREAEREAKRLHEEARLADVDALNAGIQAIDDELCSILAATLDVDDHVDLETLRATVVHPAFDPGALATPTERPAPSTYPPEPVLEEPAEPSGLTAAFARKRWLSELDEANLTYADQYRAWAKTVDEATRRAEVRDRAWQTDEQRRQVRLQQAQDRYRKECEARESEVADGNARLDALIRGLRQGDSAAVEEYISIVLANSIYPEVLEVAHEFAFDAASKELTLTVLIAPPDRLPSERSYKWVKARDETTATPLPQKALKDRYASIVDQVAVRTLHEVFEADRRGQVDTIALTVSTEAPSAATGRVVRTALTAVAAERHSFMGFDLENVVPAATLEHLAASRSKNPFGLVGIDSTAGVRRR